MLDIERVRCIIAHMKLTLAKEDVVALVDTREQTPFDLAPLKVERASLVTADYSVKGLEDVICVERKSLQDLAQCCGKERERFERVVKRMLAYPVRLLVIEATWNDIERGPGLGAWQGSVSSAVVKGSLLGWQAAGLPVLLAGGASSAGPLVANFLFIAARRRYREALAFLETQEHSGRARGRKVDIESLCKSVRQGG